MILTFDASHVRQLLDISKSCASRAPIADQLYDPEFWKDDMPEDRKMLLMSQIGTHGLAISARREDVDPEKIPAGLILVGDKGVYLMSQEKIERLKSLGVNHVCYAKEVDPENMAFDDWWEAKRASFGGDDGTVFLPADAIEAALSFEGEHIALDVTPDAISIMTPDAVSHPGLDPSL